MNRTSVHVVWIGLILVLVCSSLYSEGSVIRLEHVIRESEVRKISPTAYRITIENELVSMNDLIMLFEYREIHNATGLMPFSGEAGYWEILISDGLIRYIVDEPVWAETKSPRDPPAGSKIAIFIVKTTRDVND